MTFVLWGCEGNVDSPWPKRIERAAPAVVAIGDDRQSLATAFAIAPQILVTSDHVLARQPLYINDGKGNRSQVKTLLRDTDHDIALLETSVTFSRSLTLAASEPVVGEAVVALGNPFGGGITATLGIVSALPNAIAQTRLLQTDAAINPGNSGGPLLNADSEVLGMITSRGVPGSGVGFAALADQIQDLLDKLEPSE